MSAKFTVYPASGPNRRERRHGVGLSWIKKSIALLLVSRKVAERMHDDAGNELNAIRMLPIDPKSPLPQPLQVIHSAARYIPEEMPVLEIPGLHFLEPQSATWKAQHRQVTFA